MKERQSDLNCKSLVKESAGLVGMGLILQEQEDYINSKPLMQQGIDKIKQALVKDNVDNKAMLIEFVKIINIVWYI
jgi:hypothetical protein